MKQTDFDGQFSYSKTVAINISSAYELSSYPSPVKNKLTIKSFGKLQSEEIRIFNSLGQEITAQLTIKNVSENSITINFENLPQGIYHLFLNEKTLKILKD